MDSKSKNWKSGINTFFPIPYYLNQADEWIIDDIQEELMDAVNYIEKVKDVLDYDENRN